MKKEKYVVIDIKWDTDDDKELFDSLPQKVILPDFLSEMVNPEEEDGYLDAVSDWLSDTYGFCHGGFVVRKERITD